MKTKLWLFLTFCLILPLFLHSNPALASAPLEVAVPQDVKLTYGFVRDSADPQLMTAVVYPNVSSGDVTISTATFTFLLPANTMTDPSIAEAPASGMLTNLTGVWIVQKVTPSLYASVGFNAADLDGRDVYQAVLNPGSANPTLTADQAIPLFSFRMPNGCDNGSVELLTNDSPLQQSMLANLGANLNNQMSMSVNGMLTMDQYAGNTASGASLSCSFEGQATNKFFLPFVNR